MKRLRVKGGIEFKVFYNWQPCSVSEDCEERKRRIKEGRFNERTDCRHNRKMYKCDYYPTRLKEHEYTPENI